jgi:hypothetical protein
MQAEAASRVTMRLHRCGPGTVRLVKISGGVPAIVIDATQDARVMMSGAVRKTGRDRVRRDSPVPIAIEAAQMTLTPSATTVALMTPTPKSRLTVTTAPSTTCLSNRGRWQATPLTLSAMVLSWKRTDWANLTKQMVKTMNSSVSAPMTWRRSVLQEMMTTSMMPSTTMKTMWMATLTRRLLSKI